MYLFDFFGYLFQQLTSIIEFAVSIFSSAYSFVGHVMTLVDSLPAWLSLPFAALLLMAVIFRVTQFIPTIGGAS